MNPLARLSHTKSKNTPQDGVANNIRGETGKDRKKGKEDKKNGFKCYRCGGPHLKRDCPKNKEEETAGLPTERRQAAKG